MDYKYIRYRIMKVQKDDIVIRQFLGEDGVWYVVVKQKNGNTYTMTEQQYVNERNDIEL